MPRTVYPSIIRTGSWSAASTIPVFPVFERRLPTHELKHNDRSHDRYDTDVAAHGLKLSFNADDRTGRRQDDQPKPLRIENSAAFVWIRTAATTFRLPGQSTEAPSLDRPLRTPMPSRSAASWIPNPRHSCRMSRTEGTNPQPALLGWRHVQRSRGGNCCCHFRQQQWTPPSGQCRSRITESVAWNQYIKQSAAHPGR